LIETGRVSPPGKLEHPHARCIYQKGTNEKGKALADTGCRIMGFSELVEFVGVIGVIGFMGFAGPWAFSFELLSFPPTAYLPNPFSIRSMI